MARFGEFLHHYFSRRMLPVWALILLDIVIVYCSLLVASVARYGAFSLVGGSWQLQLIFGSYLLCFIVGFLIFRTYSCLVRYTSALDLLRVVGACTFGGISIFVARFIFRGEQIGTPTFFSLMRNIGAASFMACFVMCLMRIIVKFIYESIRFGGITYRAFVYGAMEPGIRAASAINHDPTSPMQVKGFFADEPNLVGLTIMGYEVYANDRNLLDVLRKKNINAIVVSPLKAEKFKDNLELFQNLTDAGMRIFMAPSISEMDKNMSHKALREFDIEELLYRDPISIDMGPVSDFVCGHCILVTGAAGSIGSEISRQIAHFKPSHLLMVDQAETPMHDMRLYMRKNFPDLHVSTVVASIINAERMEFLFRKYKPQYIIHAAAYKHVPMMEDNVSESIQNNVRGTEILANLAVKYGAAKFIMISTDKAVNPTNVMGCSKRLCEIYVQSLDKYLKMTHKGDTQFVTTRFGNVLGSNGSVIPLFKKQIAEGGPVTVTDPNIIRYFMTISEACNLVLEASCMGQGGEIFVFDMGRPVKISDLAKRMITLSGATDVRIVYTGLRDGEKLYEEVLSEKEGNKPTPNKKIMIASVREYDYLAVCEKFEHLIADSYSFDEQTIVGEMMQLVPEYHSTTDRFENLNKSL